MKQDREEKLVLLDLVEALEPQVREVNQDFKVSQGLQDSRDNQEL